MIASTSRGPSASTGPGTASPVPGPATAKRECARIRIDDASRVACGPVPQRKAGERRRVPGDLRGLLQAPRGHRAPGDDRQRPVLHLPGVRRRVQALRGQARPDQALHAKDERQGRALHPFAMASSVRLAWAPHVPWRLFAGLAKRPCRPLAPEPCGHGAWNGHRSHQMRPECRTAPAVSGQRGPLSPNALGNWRGGGVMWKTVGAVPALAAQGGGSFARPLALAHGRSDIAEQPCLRTAANIFELATFLWQGGDLVPERKLHLRAKGFSHFQEAAKIAKWVGWLFAQFSKAWTSTEYPSPKLFSVAPHASSFWSTKRSA